MYENYDFIHTAYACSLIRNKPMVSYLCLIYQLFRGSIEHNE